MSSKRYWAVALDTRGQHFLSEMAVRADAHVGAGDWWVKLDKAALFETPSEALRAMVRVAELYQFLRYKEPRASVGGALGSNNLQLERVVIEETRSLAWEVE